MKPIYQTKTGTQGNCLAACLASILELRITDVPRFSLKDRSWVIKIHRLLEPFGLSVVLCDPTLYTVPHGYAIGIHKKEDSKSTHAVVYLNGLVVHDPYPQGKRGKELVGLAYWLVFTVLDPALSDNPPHLHLRADGLCERSFILGQEKERRRIRHATLEGESK